MKTIEIEKNEKLSETTRKVFLKTNKALSLFPFTNFGYLTATAKGLNFPFIKRHFYTCAAGWGPPAVTHTSISFFSLIFLLSIARVQSITLSPSVQFSHSASLLALFVSF